MVEELRGKEALKHLPFADVILPKETAVKLLTENTLKSIHANIDNFNNHLKSQENSPLNSDLEQAREHFDSCFIPGGISLTEDELQYILDYLGNESYSNVVDYFINTIFMQIHKVKLQKRGNGVKSMGYILDLIDIVNPDIADYGDCVEVFLDHIRKSEEMSLFLLGSMVDDSDNLRGTTNLTMDFFMDPTKVKTFEETLIPLLTEQELDQYNRGKLITINEVMTRLTSFSAN